MRRLLPIGVILVALVAAAAASAGATATQTRIYRAFTAAGKPAIRIAHTVMGSCYIESLAADRDDAWRCISGIYIYDPCFNSAKAKRIVVCPASPWARSGIEIKLTKRLPNNSLPKPSTSTAPWALETTSGCKAILDTGATAAIGNVRANYSCDHTWLWGAPSRKTEPWMIYEAPLDAKKLGKRVAISKAWF